MKVINTEASQDSSRPLKRSMSGFEIESFIISDQGGISYEGYNLFKEFLKEFPDTTIEVEKECGKSMIELGCFPNVQVTNPAISILETFQKLNTFVKSKGYRLFPFGTYPGKMEAQFTPDDSGHYKLKKKIFGLEKFSYATKVVGFHTHYTLPKGVFDQKNKTLNFLKDSKLKRSMMNSYNFEIAVDPVLTTLTQSSPFFDGKFLAKDSRVLIYRGGKKLAFDGLYNVYQSIGGLPPYKQTLTDLLSSMERRRDRWKMLVNKADPSADFENIYPYLLDISWNPVKINKHGTLEYRGMSMNYLSIVFGVSILLNFCLQKIQREFIEIIPDDDISNAFSLENGILRIPAHTHVRNVFQKNAAYEGLKNEALFKYVSAFYKFAKSATPKAYYPLLQRVEAMINNQKTVSDEIFDYAKKNKLITQSAGTWKLSTENAEKLALHLADEFEKDMAETQKILTEITQKISD